MSDSTFRVIEAEASARSRLARCFPTAKATTPLATSHSAASATDPYGAVEVRGVKGAGRGRPCGTRGPRAASTTATNSSDERRGAACFDLRNDYGFRLNSALVLRLRLLLSEEALLIRGPALPHASVDRRLTSLAAGLEGHVRLFRLLDLCADEIARMPDYYRALLSVFVGESSSEPGSEAGPGAATAINVEIIAEVHRALRQMREQGQLADWVDLEVLADRVAAEGMICAMQWGSGELSVEGYRDAYAYATCMLLLGVTGGDAHAALLDRARQTQSGARSIQAKPAPVSGGLPGLSSGQR